MSFQNGRSFPGASSFSFLPNASESLNSPMDFANLIFRQFFGPISRPNPAQIALQRGGGSEFDGFFQSSLFNQFSMDAVPENGRDGVFFNINNFHSRAPQFQNEIRRDSSRNVPFDQNQTANEREETQPNQEEPKEKK